MSQNSFEKSFMRANSIFEVDYEFNLEVESY